MRASHWIAFLVGMAGLVWMLLVGRFQLDRLGADDARARGSLWVYAPYANPGDKIPAKVKGEGGDAISIHTVRAFIDGAKVRVEAKPSHPTTKRGRFAIGSAERELMIEVPTCLSRGDHRLTIEMESSCDNNVHGTCGEPVLEAKLHVGDTVGRWLSVLRAISAALVVYLALRKGVRPMKEWLDDVPKEKAAIPGMFVLSLGLAWLFGAAEAFARPLATAYGTDSDGFFVLCGAAWIAIGVLGVLHAREKSETLITELVARVPRSATADDDYRVTAEKRVDLDTLLNELGNTHKLRFGRVGNELKPRRFGAVPVRIVATDPSDVASGFRLIGQYTDVITVANKLAVTLGTLEVDFHGYKLRLTPETTAMGLLADAEKARVFGNAI
jgi:hypothetical protein